MDSIADKIEHKPEARGATHLQLNATLVFLDQKAHFFGRTYQSRPLEIERREGGRFSLRRPHYLYFSAQHELNCLGLVIEVILSHTNTENAVTDMTGVGWCLIDDITAPPPPNQNQAAPLKDLALVKGTPRLLLHSPHVYARCKPSEGSRIKLSISRQANFEVPLVRPYTLLGPDDKIPGMHGQQMPLEITVET